MRARQTTTILRRLAAVGGAAALALGVAALPAAADPPLRPGETPFTLDCGAGGTYEIVTARGNGAWTPAMDVAGTTVFVPVAFGPSSGAVYDAATDELLAEFSDDSTTVKGQGKARGGTPLDCTFTASFAGFDEEFGTEVYGTFSGQVSLLVRP